MTIFSIGICTYSTKPRGSVVHAVCLAEALERRGARVSLLALSKDGDEFFRPVSCALELIAAAAAPSGVEQLILQRIAEFSAGLRKLRARPKILHAQDCLVGSALALCKAELGASAVVRTVHHVERFDSPYLMACQERSIVNADLVLSVSEYTRREVLAEFAREAAVVSNGVDVERFRVPLPLQVENLRQRIGLEAGEPLIVSVGGVEPRKNSLRALEAMARAFEAEPRLRWVIAGGASIWEHEAYRTEFARRLAALPAELRSRIVLLGTLGEHEITALYQLADILLCPSEQEGFGLCVLEALAAKTPVIVARGAPFDEYLDERCARFVDSTSAEQIAKALIGLLADEAARQELAEHGYERARRYSWERVADRHLVHYESTLRPSSAVRQSERF